MTAVQDCLKSQRGRDLKGERCIGVIADPCLKRGALRRPTRTACADRELSGLGRHPQRDLPAAGASVSTTSRRPRPRDMQRAWIELRDKTCAFYWDFYQGTMASPMSAYCDRARDRAPRHVPASLPQ